MSNNTIFRKSSLERVSSPEQLGDYIKVSRPSVWLVLGAVMILLIGVCFWGIFGTLTTTYEGVVVVERDKSICYVTIEEAKNLGIGMEVRIGDRVGSITSVGDSPIQITEDFNAYALYLSGWKVEDWVVPVTVEIAALDGVYKAQIVLETISPISFLLN